MAIMLKTSQRTERAVTRQRARGLSWQDGVSDALALLIPLAVLALVIAQTVSHGVIVYPNAQETSGDFYRYVNMALPHGIPFYALQDPFVYRILEPYTVRLLITWGVPLTAGFFSIACVSLSASTILIYFLARGAGIGRVSASCAALAFVTLYWTVGYDAHDYFLVDPPTQAFIIAVLLATQREKYYLAGIIATIGIVCKETLYLPAAVAAVQLLIPYLRPLSGSVKALTQGHVIALVRRIPKPIWQRLAVVIGGPALAFEAVHFLVRPLQPSHKIWFAIYKVWIPRHFVGPNPAAGLENSFVASAWGTYGVLFFLVVAAFALRLWPRSRWSGWSLVTAALILLYSYTVSGDNERLSIVGWPFAIVLAALAIQAISQHSRVPAVLLWAVVLLSQTIYQANHPVLGLLPGFTPVANEIALPSMTLLAALVVVAIYRLYQQTPLLPAFAPMMNGGGITEMHELTMTGRQAALPALAPVANDADSIFWNDLRGGVTALLHHDTWVANRRLYTLVATTIFPLALRARDLDPATHTLANPNDEMLDRAVGSWLPEPTSANLWHAYSLLSEEYPQLSARLGIAATAALRQEVATIMDIGLRQQTSDATTAITPQSISIVLPAYNEAGVIADTVQTCLRFAQHYCPNLEVVIVDDGSRDATGAISDELAAHDARVRVVHNRPNKGYGGALLAGFAAAEGEWLFFMDSDGQFDIKDIAKLLAVAVAHPQTVVVGYREHRQDAALRRLNAWGWKQVVGMTLGVRGIRDIDCAFKLLPTNLVRACDVTAQGAMVNTELFAKFQRMQVPIVQVPVQHLPRIHGQATGANPRVILKAFRELLHLRSRLKSWRPTSEPLR